MEECVGHSDQLMYYAEFCFVEDLGSCPLVGYVYIFVSTK